MTVTVSPVSLLRIEDGIAIPADLLDAITEENLADWEAEWTPELLKAIQRLHRSGVDRRLWPQSRHWDWRRKYEALRGMLSLTGYSIVCAGMTQGMMIVDTAKRRCRLERQKGQHLVYVEFLENAPWNRASLFDPPRYRGVGTVLIRTAIELSKAEDFRGRIGLHSLPQSNAFYARTCGMTDLGVDPDPNYAPMRYFEMTEEQAEAFIAKGQKP